MYILHGTKDSSRSNFKMCEISVKIRVYGYNEVIMNWRLVTSHLSVRGLSRKPTEGGCSGNRSGKICKGPISTTCRLI